MDVKDEFDTTIAKIAAAIGEPARVRILYCLLDGHARTATELAVVANVTPSTASAHLTRLMKERLIKMFSQGKHRYYSLVGSDVANALEGLSVIAGGSFVPNTPTELREARTCYDHVAGKLGVLLHHRLTKMRWISADDYKLSPEGIKGLKAIGVDVDATRNLRRRFAYACIDWSERQPHLGGGLGAAIFKIALQRKWVVQEFDSRALKITRFGRRELLTQFGVQL